ncbi:hypothetical protein ACF1AY_38630 [Streptomyces sp. NPDC014776]|uniref:hypothetical protein n=1 Tax=Streptomyces sp. NPDC014776 TaxID=3364909 RepID=UPI0036FBACEA
MLARLPLAYLLIMSAFSTFLFCFAVDRWMKVRALTLVFLGASVACCAGMVAVGQAQAQHWDARQMLVLYSFAWAGLAIGLLPYRTLLLQYGEGWQNDTKRARYEYPGGVPGRLRSRGVAASRLGLRVRGGLASSAAQSRRVHTSVASAS